MFLLTNLEDVLCLAFESLSKNEEKNRMCCQWCKVKWLFNTQFGFEKVKHVVLNKLRSSVRFGINPNKVDSILKKIQLGTVLLEGG